MIIIETIKAHITLIGMSNCFVMWIFTKLDFALYAGVIIAVLSIAIKIMQAIEQYRKTFKKKKRKKK